LAFILFKSRYGNAFLEELIVRRELSDNFCFYNPQYDNFQGFPAWAKETLNKHRCDEREYTYSPEQFENARTHDELIMECCSVRDGQKGEDA